MTIQAILPMTGAKAPFSSSKAAAEPTTDMRKTASDFESVFIAEMLTHAGFEKAFTRDAGFGGEAMASFMTEQIAQKLSAHGGFGIADAIAKQLLRNANEIADQ